MMATAAVLALALCAGLCSAAATPSVFPGAAWLFKTPAQCGMDATKLGELRDFMGGRGCVVRHGYMVYTWGDQSKRADVASACKPLISHFLFKALDDGKIPSLDQRVSAFEPRLYDINPALGHKDSEITWRHMANQISCYGVSEKPGTAYDYNDFQMALFWDILFRKVYGVTPETVDEEVLRPLLTGPMQCEDNPTFLPFGPSDRVGRFGVSVRDYARFGLLYLNKGDWNGRQLLSSDCAVRAVTSPLPNSILRTKAVAAEMIAGQRSIGSTILADDQADHDGSYSWLWWINGVSRNGKRNWPDAPVDTFAALGHTNGKRGIAVVPSLDMVISYNDTTLDRRDGNPLNDALKLASSSVKDAPKAATGQIVVDPAKPRWLARSGIGPLFMCGPGDPEDFLYRGTRNPDGTRNGDQTALINKLKGTGANCVYMQIVRSHGGDGDKTHNPFVDSDPSRGLDQSILSQWESWFDEMDRNNIVIFLILYDDGARIWKTGDIVGPDEKSFIQGIVRRFEHHNNLIWCVAEEYQESFSAKRVSSIAAEIRAADSKRHPIAVHKLNGLDFGEFADDPNIDQFAMQYNVGTAADLHGVVVAAWKSAGGKYNLNMSEAADYGTGAEARKKSWAVAMAGAYVMILGMDIANTPASDLKDCGRLVRFFESTRFDEMSPRDDLAFGGTQYVLAKPGSAYIAYSFGLKRDIGLSGMTAGIYDFTWYDCATGKSIKQANIPVASGSRTWRKPVGIGDEVAVYIRRVGKPAATSATQ